MVLKGTRGGISHSIYRYSKVNHNYMKYYDKSKESSYIQYRHVNNLYGWAMFQKLPVKNFEWIKDTSQFNENLIRNYNKESDEGHFLEADAQYPEKLRNLHNDLLFLPKRVKFEKVKKLVTNLHGKTEYVIYVRIRLGLKKVLRVIKFNQNPRLKPYIGMIADLEESKK